MAWTCAREASAAVALNHVTYRAAAAAIAVDVGPSHGPLVNPEITEAYEAVAACNWSANSAHAAAAASIGLAPGPKYIRPELISGGKAPKSIPDPLAN
ncbi:hypothetical protein LRC484719_08850 [Mycobacterium riyadhense]